MMNLIISLNYSTLIKVSKYLELVQISLIILIKHTLIGKNWPFRAIGNEFVAANAQRTNIFGTFS